MAKDKNVMPHGTWVPNASGMFILRGLRGFEKVPDHKQGLPVVPLNREPFYRLYEQNAEFVRQQRGNEPGWSVPRYPREKCGEWHAVSAQKPDGELEIALFYAGKEFYRCKMLNGRETGDPRPTRLMMEGDEDDETPETAETTEPLAETT